MNKDDYSPWLPSKSERVVTPEASEIEHAIRANDRERLQACIAARYRLDEINGKGHVPLTFAAQLGHATLVRDLLAAGADLNATTVSGAAAIHCARNPETLDVLLDAGADINMPMGRRNTTLLCAASGGSGTLPIVKALLKRGADLNLADGEGRTPLIAAATNLNLPVLRELISAGAELDLQDKNGSTALICTALGSDRKGLQAAEELIAAGANVNAMRPDRMTAIRYACSEGKADLVATLVQAGADVNATNRFNESALMTVIHNAPKARYDIAKILLEAGADKGARVSENHPDAARRGRTPRDRAADKRDKKMLALLDEYAAK